MTDSSEREEVKIEISETRKFFEEEGSSRAITSGSLTLLFALFSSGGIWTFLIIASGWDGLQFFGLIIAIYGIVAIFSLGFTRYFVVEIKENLIIDEDTGKVIAATYSKIILLIGILLSVVLLVLGVLSENILLRLSFYGSFFNTIFGYINSVLQIGLEIKNRYDVVAFINGSSGILLLIGSLVFMSANVDPTLFAFYPIFYFIPMLIYFYFFRKIAPYRFRDILFAKLFPKNMKKKVIPEKRQFIDTNQVKNFFKSSFNSIIINTENSGIFRNLLVLFAAVYLAIFHPEMQGFSVSILTILLAYGAVKNIIVYYSAPLTVEIAEAVVKENQQIIEDSVNDATRVSCTFSLGFLLGMIVLSDALLILLHEDLFIENFVFNLELFKLAQILFILIIIGEFMYGYSTLFGNALIGSGNIRIAAIGFGITLLIITFLSPIFIFFFDVLGIGYLMVLSALFLLPYMLLQLKRKLKIKFKFRLIRLVPNLALMSIFLFLFPINNFSSLFLGMAIISIIYIVLIPLLGISIPKDIQMLYDLFKTMKVKPIGKFFANFMKIVYNISPFNKNKIVLEY